MRNTPTYASLPVDALHTTARDTLPTLPLIITPHAAQPSRNDPTATPLAPPHAPFYVYALQGHFSDDDGDRMRRLLIERLAYREQYPDDTCLRNGQPCADCLALHFAHDMTDFWMGAQDGWPSGARLFDPRHLPFADVVDAARDAISAWWIGAQAASLAQTGDQMGDVCESDADAVDLIASHLEQFIS